MIALKARDFDAKLGQLSMPEAPGCKTGERTVTLSVEARQFFAELAAGRHPDDVLFTRDDGTPWQGSRHSEPFAEAAKRAKLPKGATLYCPQHTYISQALMGAHPRPLSLC